MPLDAQDIATIATLPRSEYWRSLRKWLDDEKATVRNKIRNNPQVNDKDFRQDIKWLLSREALIDELIELPNKIREREE